MPPGAGDYVTMILPKPSKLQMFLFSVLICSNRPFGSCEASVKSDGMKPVGKGEGTYLPFTYGSI